MVISLSVPAVIKKEKIEKVYTIDLSPVYDKVVKNKLFNSFRVVLQSPVK